MSSSPCQWYFPRSRLKPLPNMAQSPRSRPLHCPQFISLSRLIRRSIISRIRRENLKLNRAIPLSVCTLCCSFCQVLRSWGNFTSCNILSADRPLEDLQCYQRLVEGDFVAGFVDTRECKFTSLLDLAVDDVVGCCNIGISSAVKACCVDFVRYELASKPVAAIVPISYTRNQKIPA